MSLFSVVITDDSFVYWRCLLVFVLVVEVNAGVVG